MLYHKHTLTLRCDNHKGHSAGLVQEFDAQTKQDALYEARRVGWKINVVTKRVMCPACRRSKL